MKAMRMEALPHGGYESLTDKAAHLPTLHLVVRVVMMVVNLLLTELFNQLLQVEYVQPQAR